MRGEGEDSSSPSTSPDLHAVLRLKQRTRLVIESCLLLLIAAIASNTWLLAGVMAPIVVRGESMLPTLTPGQRLLVDRAAFNFAPPRRWQLVVLHCPEEESILCIKRIVGLPGETIEIRDGRLWIDGQSAEFDGRRPYTFAPIGQGAQYRLGAGEYFLLGDNLADSLDSRWWQPAGVGLKSFVGRPLCRDPWAGAVTADGGTRTSQTGDP